MTYSSNESQQNGEDKKNQKIYRLAKLLGREVIAGYFVSPVDVGIPLWLCICITICLSVYTVEVKGLKFSRKDGKK